MSKALINFNFNAVNIVSSVGNFTANFQGASVTPGEQGQDVIDLGNSGHATVDLTGLIANPKKFCINVTFKVNQQVTNRQNIVESDFLPFAIYASAGTTASTFEIVTSVKMNEYGWSNVNTAFNKTLKINTWYTASLVYDLDTLGLFIGDELISIHGFPKGLIKLNSTKKLFIGSWGDGVKFQFNGSLAGFEWYEGIPDNLESLLDERRSSPDWFITYKEATIKSKLNLGKRINGIKYDSSTGSHTQYFDHVAIMYHESAGAAFEMHGAIYTKFKSLPNKSAFGYLVTDEVQATRSHGRKNLFSKGGIYWSGATGAVPVLDKIYLEYENLGESKAFGFPTSSMIAIPGGEEQIFEGCRMYYKNGTGRAQEVHGDILVKYLNLGGPLKWGFPVSNEMDVINNGKAVGKYSEFEHCKIYWRAGIGAFELHGLIRKRFENTTGAIDQLGFPTSDEVDIPKHSGIGRMNTFENGSLLWFGGSGAGSVIAACPFQIYLHRISTREDEGWGAGENDIKFWITIKNGNQQIYYKRFPTSGDYGDHNIIEPKVTFPVIIKPNNINQEISYSVVIKDDDDTSGDDHLGSNTTILNAANAWGFMQTNLVFDQAFGKTKSFLWSIKPQIDLTTLPVTSKWWSFANFKTPTVTKNQYASAFRDVDSEPEWWDIFDGLRLLYYELVVKGICSGGNCVGMSLEAIYALKGTSLFGQPLSNVTQNNAANNEINIRHTYQVGARSIWWYLEQFVTGNTHNPVDVFNASRNAFNRGDNPLICISQNYDFSGAPHCVMPYEWDSSSKPWKIKIMDPNFPNNSTKVITVDPDKNEFQYISSSSRKYNGSRWDGGRFHYIPFCIVDHRPRTPMWEAILLLLSGTIIILADDAETVSIKDAAGKDLNGNGSRANALMKSGGKPEEFFASFVGFERGVNLKPGQIMMRREQSISSNTISEPVRISSLPIVTLASTEGLRGFTGRSLPTEREAKRLIENRTVRHVLNDPIALKKLNPTLLNELKKIQNINDKRNFKHTIKGVKNGKLQYMIKSGLSEITIESTINKNEQNTLSANNINTNACSIDFKSPVDKLVNLTITSKLGVNGDHVIMKLNNIPVQANKSLEMNVKSGLAGLELVNKGVTASLSMNISTNIDGLINKKDFNLPFDGAMRIKPSTILHSNELLVSNITKLFGTIKNTITVIEK